VKLLVSALEPSSNLHLKALLEHLPDVELLGIFDRSLGTPLYDISQMAVMGISDAVKRIPWFYKVADEMVKQAADAEKILLMDGSGFNLPLAKRLKKAYPHKEILYYILPQVWVSRPGRVKRLEAYCDRLLGILPFETAYYSKKAEYVGHPLLDEISVEREASSRSEAPETIAYLPGSRRAEIMKLMPIYRQLREKLPPHRALLVTPPSFSRETIEALYGDIGDFELSGDTHKALSHSDFAYICSGTATLEAALIGTPFTLNYIAKKLDFFVGTKLLGIKQAGLANIILTASGKEALHNELLQDQVTLEALIEEYHRTDREKFKARARELREYLGHGSSEKVARIIYDNTI